jgi:hypothetical protein
MPPQVTEVLASMIHPTSPPKYLKLRPTPIIKNINPTKPTTVVPGIKTISTTTNSRPNVMSDKTIDQSAILILLLIQATKFESSKVTTIK